MESREIKIKNRAGKFLFCRIDGIVLGKTLPAVLVVHGFKGNSSERHIRAISDALINAGFLTCRPDLTKNPGRSYLPFEDMTYSQELLDIEDVFDYLLNLPNVDKSRIGVTGHSLGGMLAAELASKKTEIKSLATLSAVYDYAKVIEKSFKRSLGEIKKDFKKKGWTYTWSTTLNNYLKIKQEFYKDIIERTAADFCSRITCPTLVISSGDDGSVNQSHADRYIKTLGSKTKKMEIIEGADHVYSGQSLDKVARFVADWFQKTL